MYLCWLGDSTIIKRIMISECDLIYISVQQRSSYLYKNNPGVFTHTQHFKMIHLSVEVASAVTKTWSLTGFLINSQLCSVWCTAKLEETGHQCLWCERSQRTVAAGRTELNAVVWFCHHRNHINPATFSSPPSLSFFPSHTDTQTHHPILLHRGSRLARFPKAFWHSWLFLSQPEPPETNSRGSKSGKTREDMAEWKDRKIRMRWWWGRTKMETGEDQRETQGWGKTGRHEEVKS